MAVRYVRPMPIYEFHCEKCAKDSEILVRSNDWKGTKCPHCGSEKLSKKFSVFASSGAEGSNAAATKPSGGGCGRCCGGGPHHHH
jgi:putative FmdB family regulatory protein